MDDSRPLTLALFPLPSPYVLFPGARLSIPVSPAVAAPLIKLLTEADGQLTVAAIPIIVAHEANGIAKQHWNLWGCSARVVRIVRPPTLQVSQSHLVSIEGIHRVKLQSTPSLETSPPLTVVPVLHPPSSPPASGQAIETFKGAALHLADTFRHSGHNRKSLVKFDSWSQLREFVESVGSDNDESRERAPLVADRLIAILSVDYQDKLEYLAIPVPDDRLKKASELFHKKVSIAQVQNKVVQDVQDQVSRQQKELVLRQSLQSIQRELSLLNRSKNGSRPGSPGSPAAELDDEDDAYELTELKKKIEAMCNGTEEKKIAVREFKRLKRIPPASVENSIIRNYLDWLTSLPWPSSTPLEANELHDKTFLNKARNQLEEDHFGMEQVKRRLIEFLAVMRLKEMAAMSTEQAVVPAESPAPNVPKRISNKGPILLLCGPPGVGKTSIASSLARALNRPFHRISLGGVRDEAEIRGHRRTYVASGPGNIVQALRKVGRPDPVILLDEIDKVGHSNHQGDPSAALLEVLDPEQNHSFTDHYINTPVDLSQITFIATANSLETISAPLLDRCEIIRLEGYTFDEKVKIAKRWLVPKQLKANGFGITNGVVDESKFSISDDTLIYVVTHYTRESGVRSLERAIGAVVRFKAVEWSDLAEPSSSQRKYDPVIKVADLEKILGAERFEPEAREKTPLRGSVYGMVVMGEGEGGILPVETVAVPGTGQLRLTGSLGDVIKESADIALTWVKAHAYPLGITPSPSVDVMKHPDVIDIHLHLPAGAQKKDGPSAGIAMVCAFVSLLSGTAVPTHIAMTGEITLRGNVTPVGGVKEKVLGAHRAGITKVILPQRNRKDVEDGGVPKEIQQKMELVYVSTIVEALGAAFEGVIGWREGAPGFPVESRL